jgi:hypothetical protein
VTASKKPFEQSIVEQWPEIFSDISLSAVPIPYLHSVVVTFHDGNKWNIVIRKEDRESAEGGLPKTLQELFQNYETQIMHVDFRLDIERIKKDIMKSTKKVLRKKK